MHLACNHSIELKKGILFWNDARQEIKPRCLKTEVLFIPR